MYLLLVGGAYLLMQVKVIGWSSATDETTDKS